MEFQCGASVLLQQLASLSIVAASPRLGVMQGYELQGPIGQGQFGCVNTSGAAQAQRAALVSAANTLRVLVCRVVYKARCKADGTLCCIKRIPMAAKVREAFADTMPRRRTRDRQRVRLHRQNVGAFMH